ncbi:hypothetical protein GJD58_28310, partial [Klebsiella pneumoniae]|nr:hypothetical protein [Klebsiella pneumoniae]
MIEQDIAQHFGIAGRQRMVDEVLDNVDARTRNFLLKSSLLRSMNDALIVRVTGEENGQM